MSSLCDMALETSDDQTLLVLLGGSTWTLAFWCIFWTALSNQKISSVYGLKVFIRYTAPNYDLKDCIFWHVWAPRLEWGPAYPLISQLSMGKGSLGSMPRRGDWDLSKIKALENEGWGYSVVSKTDLNCKIHLILTIMYNMMIPNERFVVALLAASLRGQKNDHIYNAVGHAGVGFQGCWLGVSLRQFFSPSYWPPRTQWVSVVNRNFMWLCINSEHYWFLRVIHTYRSILHRPQAFTGCPSLFLQIACLQAVQLSLHNTFTLQIEFLKHV